jgi:hypothetical protein
MFGKITLAVTLMVSGVAFGQNTQQPSSTSNVQTQPANSLPRQCWDTHTNQARPVTAADSKAVPQGPIETTRFTYGGIVPGSKADRPAGMPLCD